MSPDDIDPNRRKLSDDEYRNWLEVLAKKHLRLTALIPEGGRLAQEIERLSHLAQLARVAKETAAEELDREQTELYDIAALHRILAQGLNRAGRERILEHIVAAMER